MRRFRLLTPFLLTPLLLLAACNNTNGTVMDDGTSTSSVPAMDSYASSSESTASVPDTMVPPETSSDQAAMDTSSAGAPAAGPRVVDMSVTNFSFAPNAIIAKQGEKLVVRLTGVDGHHSFAVEDLGINVPINPGESKDVEIPTDKAGTYQFRCRIPCGPGHKDMVGTIVVN